MENRKCPTGVALATRPDHIPGDPGAYLRDDLESLLTQGAIGLDARMRHAISATVHLAVDAPPGLPTDTEDFLARLDAMWLLAVWSEHDAELSLLATLAAGEVPALSWCELMFTTALAPWSAIPAAVRSRELFGDRSEPRTTENAAQ
ncbi:hypothetical protein [Nocardia sp. NBC_00511]|uniref:hypothetical protein n=1 Tax=Nocardia sp. NBC_00511 TaxID=2903591 RepID=UPI0030E10EF4